MKLFNGKEDAMYLTKKQWKKLFLAMTIMTLVVYAIAMVFSLNGSDYFILNYQNAQMDRIEAWAEKYNVMILIDYAFMTLEFALILTFVLNKRPSIFYILAFYIPPMLVEYLICDIPTQLYSIFPFIFYLLVPIIDDLITNKKVRWKNYLFCLLKTVIAVVVTLILQAMILVIKTGSFNGQNNVQPLATAFIYAIEYDIALAIILFTIRLFLYREKGDSKVCQKNADLTHHNLGGSSQTSKTKSQKSSMMKTLSKTQRNKIRLLYVKVYFIQLGTFLFVMILPFLLGKVFEFLVMYLAFVVSRYLLGFNYSLHYKKEAVCAFVGAIVFGILSLAVPFFYVVVIIAVTLGVSLAVLLHLSYKYKGMFLFAQIAKPDKFAEIYVIFDGNLEIHHVRAICFKRGLDTEQTNLVCEVAEGNKKSYIAKKYNYSEKTIERKLNEAIETLKHND